MIIREARYSDFDQWNMLWQGYLQFYKTDLSDDVTQATWDRILSNEAPLFCQMAINEHDDILGFSLCVVHAGTWSNNQVCYLEDLFVSSKARGQGVGKALIQSLIQISKTKGWSKLYWHTDEDNQVARKLYDSFSSPDKTVNYSIEIK